MSNFNYQKAYCVNAVPAFLALSQKARDIHSKLIPLVGELQQGRNLDIPLSPAIEGFIGELSTREIAEMSRASYFVGHWHQSLLPRIFETSRGESWKIANCCDQVLRKRLTLPHNIEIHEGKLRVTFSNKDCWLGEEFALATEDNLQAFKRCDLPFGEGTLNQSAEVLKVTLNDLWDLSVPENDLYRKFLHLKKEQERRKIKNDSKCKIESLEKIKANAQKKIDFLFLCCDHNIPTDNVIYYSHTDSFCFGWHTPLSIEDKEKIASIFSGLNHSYIIDYN